jgi:hypothetical protein
MEGHTKSSKETGRLLLTVMTLDTLRLGTHQTFEAGFRVLLVVADG